LLIPRSTRQCANAVTNWSAARSTGEVVIIDVPFATRISVSPPQVSASCY
jgi:hypothetical protein